MDEQEVNVELITQAGIRRLLSFLPLFVDTRANHGAGPTAEDADENTITIRPAILSGRASGFVAACCDENFVQPFDWGEWSRDHESELCSHEFISNANLATIVRMLTTHIRADRFCDGHLLAVMKKGTIGAILNRLRDIESEQANIANPRGKS